MYNTSGCNPLNKFKNFYMSTRTGKSQMAPSHNYEHLRKIKDTEWFKTPLSDIPSVITKVPFNIINSIRMRKYMIGASYKTL